MQVVVCCACGAHVAGTLRSPVGGGLPPTLRECGPTPSYLPHQGGGFAPLVGTTETSQQDGAFPLMGRG